jgi:rhodanese-related sulfurtransferase
MKEKIRIFRLYVFIVLFTVLSAQAGDDIQSSATVIEANAARDFVTEHEDAVILDVRTPFEYEMSHITGSVNADVQDQSFEDMVANLDPNKKYIVHCAKNPSNGRSSRALESMQKLGFEHLYSLEGGFVAWKDAELPLTETSN